MIVFLLAWLAFDLAWWQALILGLLAEDILSPLLDHRSKTHRVVHQPTSSTQ